MTTNIRQSLPTVDRPGRFGHASLCGVPADRDELADVPPERFVAARDELVKRLKDEGNAAEAAEIKKLRKPSVAQWITAQVRRHHAADVDALRAASSEVAAAQEMAITSGNRDALRDASAQRRDALDQVGRAVDEVLAKDLRPAQYRDEVLSVIESDVTAEIAAGTFGLREDLELPERPKKKPARDRAAERRAAEAKAAVEAAEERVRRARDALERAESDLEALRERQRSGERG
jgi:hypothetical protein